MKKPYTVLESNEKWEIREFIFTKFNFKGVFWHRDKEDRILEVLQGTMHFQIDNQIPVDVLQGETIEVPKLRFHRVLPFDDFIVKIHFQ